MDDEKWFKGFDHDFLIDETIRESVPFPVLRKRRKNELNPVRYNEKTSINYLNYSVQLSASRKFPIFTATNINGQLFRQANRASDWKRDERVEEFQWGVELYSARKSDFDKGHMTKREDVQWGEDPLIAQKAADSTFFYTNAVPQHKDLNQQVWKNLEDYILHTETRKRSMKICVFTGPVLSKNDPPFVTMVNGKTVLLPTLFWKVVIYPKEDGKLYRAGFLMSQKKLLAEDGIIRPAVRAAPSGEEVAEPFARFDDAETYQVNISLIESLTDLKIPKAIDSFKDNRNRKLVLKEVEVSPKLKTYSMNRTLGFSISNIVL